MTNNGNNKDPIEKFFKRKVWNYDISYEESDWKDIEKRLEKADKAEMTSINRHRKRVAAAILALLLCTIAYLTYENYTTLDQINEQLNEQEVISEENDTLGDRSSDRQENPEQIDKKNESVNSDEKSDQNNNNGRDIATTPVQNSHLNKKNKAEADGSRIEREEELTEWTVSKNESETLFISELMCQNCSTFSFASRKRLSEATKRDASLHGIPSEALSSSSTRSVHANVYPRGSSGVGVSFVMAPDLSTAGGLSHFENPGYKIGIGFEINLSTRLAVTTGIIHSNVNYQARGREYKPPPGYWPNGIPAQKTLAECALIDIPLNLKYDFLHFERSRFFATAGLSSYIMLSEDYRFQYDTENLESAREWSSRTGTRHWFSNASFSLGYEFDVLPAWSLQVEPFVKLPLKEIGWGNVKLYSVGSFISLNYKFR